MGGRQALALMLTVFMILTLLLTLTSLSSTLALSQETHSWSRSTWVLLPAVVENPSGYSGTLVNATLTLSYPGTGQVVVYNGTGMATGSTLYSMKMAFAVAMIYAGLNWRSYNLIIHLNFTGPVSGPSGSFAIMLATYALATGISSEPLHRYAITGAVSPSGLSGPVGGLEYKCMAASEGHVSIMYPIGDLVSGSEYCSNVSSLPVSGIMNVLASVYNIMEPTPSLNITLAPFQAVMKNVSEQFINSTNGLLDYLNGHLSRLDGNKVLLSNATAFVNTSHEDLSLALRYLDSLPYASASYAFNAYYYALAANYTLWAYESHQEGVSVTQPLIKIANNVSSYVTGLLSNLTSYERPSASLSYYELLATAAARMADALYYSQYVSYLTQEPVNIDDAYVLAYYTALAKARIPSALGWIETAKALSHEPPNITLGLLNSTAAALEAYTNLTVSYASSLIEYYASQFESIGDVSAAQELLAMESDLQYLFSLGQKLANGSNLLGAIGAFQDALTQSLQIIFIEATQSFSTPSISSRVISSYADELVHEYDVISSALLMRSLPSYVDSAYMNYARTLMNVDPQSAIYIMETAVVDSLSWYLGSISYSSAAPAVVVMPSEAIEEGVPTTYYVSIALASAALGALLTAAIALWYYKRSYAS